LVDGLKKFQYLNHCKVTGKMDSTTLNLLNKNIEEKLQSLALNMDRLRWMKHDFPQPYIWVDVPKMELNYVEKDSVQFNMRVVVGRPGRPTTTLDAALENIVLSPPWTVPPTIMKEEVVPGIARRGGSYLLKRGLKAYDRRGRIVNATLINDKNYKRYTIGQAPGYRSSLGEVKFNLPNPWSIYLHDTPHREDFVKFYRAYSSGCIRVQKPKQFAEFLLRDTLEYSYAKIDSICKTRKTVFIPVNRNIAVHIVYLTNALDSTGKVMYLRDIYKWDKKS
jgi:murein L,D-transpeptidase YcbB/YkuD